MNASPETSKPAAASIVWSVLVVLSACVVAMAFRVRECFVDDAFIGFQYVSNLLAGRGFVFFPGAEPVEGMTNIGWLLLLAPLSMLTEPTVAAKLAGLALVLLTLILTVCLGQRLAARCTRPEDSFGLVFPPALMLVTSYDFTYFSLAGMETALLATLLMLMACVALSRPRSNWLPVLGALAFLVHPEAVAVYPAYTMLGWSHNVAHTLRVRTSRAGASAGRGFVWGNLILAALVCGITAARFGYFHDVVPNTFHAKPSDLRLAVQNGYAFLMGQNVNVAFPVTGWLAIPVLLLGYRRLRRAAPAAADMLAAIGGVGLLFAIYSPPDWTGLARYFAPYLPAALLLLWAGVGEAIGLLWPPAADAAAWKPRLLRAAPVALAAALVLANIADGQAKLVRSEVYPGYVLTAKNLIAPAQWMRDHLPADATIATRRIGVLAYHSRRKVFDYTYGLPNPEVARLVGQRGQRFDMPTDPGLAALWRAHAPDFLLEDGPVIDMIAQRAGGTRSRFSIHGIPYHVVERFPIGNRVEWVLARRIGR